MHCRTALIATFPSEALTVAQGLMGAPHRHTLMADRIQLRRLPQSGQRSIN
jgi:hypothetical protein